MKNIFITFFFFLLQNSLYSQINVVVKTMPNGKVQFVNKMNKAAVNNDEWNEVESFVNGFAKAYGNGFWTLVDKNGSPISTNKYDAVRNFSNGYAAINANSKWGFINEQGKTMIPTEYDIVFDFKENVTAAYKNKKWFLIDANGLVKKALDIDVFYGFKNNTAAVLKDGKKGKMNLNGDIISLEPKIAEGPTTQLTTKQSLIALRPQSAPCPPNIGFDFNNFTNWNCFIGSVSSSGTTNIITVVPSAPLPTRHEIYPASAGLDPYGLFPTAPPDGSGFALKLGNNINGSKAERVVYQLVIPVGSTDASITYRYAVVFQDPGHLTHQQPRFSAKLRDVATNTYLPCASYEYIADSAVAGFFDSPIDDTVKCKNWSSVFINLSAYAGKTLDLEFTTADCTLGAHWGYAYVDVGDCNIAANIAYQCSPSVATVNAPPGFQFYNWWNSNFTQILATGQNTTISPIPPNSSTLHVEVIPFNGSGCKDTLDVMVGNIYGVADAGPDKTICAGNAVSIGVPSSSLAPGDIYSWSPATYLSNASIANPIANPPVSTTYILTVTNPAYLCPKNDTVNVIVNPKPIPAFSLPASQCISGNNFTFSNTSTGGTTYLWNFGDGTTSNLQNPTHTYAAAAAYTVKLVVTNSNGCKDSISQSINVFAKPNPAFAVPPGQCISGNNFVFNNTSTGGATYLWNFGDGTTSNAVSPTHTYATAAAYTVKLIVTNSNGCKDSISQNINVFAKPTPAFALPPGQCISGNNFTFNNTSTGGATYLWNFGDGTTSNVMSPTHTYATAAAYTVKLIVTNSNGCKDSISQSINVFAKPTPAFAIPPGQCISGNNFAFNNTSTGGATYLWLFGDGTTSSATNPTHTYATAAAYTVKLVVTNSNGCKDSISQSINVFAKPTPAFAIPPGQCISGNNFTFNNSSTGGATYLWNFGDGTTSNQQNPTHTYTTANNYTVKLIVTNSNGCKDSISQSINVFAKPTPAFAIPPGQCISNNNFAFNNTSTGGATYLWLFGDGTTSNQQNPTHTYTTANNYTVKLIVTNSNGCKDSISQSINVFAKPTPAFAIPPGQCISGNNFAFNNTSTGGATYLWNFGDGTTSSATNPTHTYTTAAAYTVKLIVTNSNGCKDSISQNINVFAKPTPAFAVPPGQCISGNNFTFNNSSIGGATYLWNFGDGTTSSATNPTHTYATAAAYTVKLIVTNSNGCKDSISQNINVFAKPTPAFAVPPGQCISGNNFAFNNTSTGGATYLWTFGDGTTSNQQNPTHTYANAAAYTVKLVVTNSNGCKDSISQNINVFAKPNPAFAIPPGQCISGNNFVFNNTSTGGATYLWLFGDGTTSNQQNPTHTYTTANNYTVKLIVTNSNGCKDSISQNINVFAKPNPAFAVPPGQCVSGNNFAFNNTSTGGTTYLWNFGDGTTSNAPNPTHTYATAAAYTVKLIVTNSNGCKDSISQNINVFAKPNPAFAVPPGQCISGNNFAFINTSTGGATYLWNFGDGTTSSATNPTHTYATAAAYTVKLIVTNSNGCKDSISQSINVFAKPNPAFALPPGQCISGNNFAFNNTSTGGATYLWLFGDGTTSNQQNPTHTYTTANNYTVKLIVTNSNGCKDSISQSINVFAKPNPAFAVPPGQCISGNNFTFNNSSTGGTTYLWLFGDGTTSNQQNPTHTYTTANNYTVKLIVTNSNGCTDSISQNINVFAKPNPAFVVPQGQCISNNNFAFNNTSTGGATYLWLFGDGSTSNQQNPTHTYTTANNYTVKLIVTNSNGCKDSISQNINVFAKPNPAFIVPPGQCISNNNFAFNNTSTGGATYLWLFGDGTTSNQQNPTHTYTTANNYTVKLIVTNSNGCKDSISQSINVFAKPTPAFALPPGQCISGNNFAFNNTSTGGSTYLWSFGDGTTSNQQNPTHTYATAAAYTVQLIVTNSNGCTDSTSQNINVFAKPNPAFAVPPGQCVSGNNFTFNNSSTGGATYLWNFGDGITSNQQNPTHTYATANNYTVKLIVTNSNGCTDSVSNMLNVYPTPQPAFAAATNQCINNNNFNFVNQSTGGATYLWNFGDGATSSLVNPSHTYTTPGSYNVTLVITNANGCADSIMHPVTIFARPVAAFDPPASQCLTNNNFSFLNNSTGGSNYLWNFGDGTSSNALNAQHSYSVAGSYTIQLLTTNTSGCRDSIQHTVVINSSPVINMGNNYNVCVGNSVQLSAQGAQTYQWSPTQGLSCSTCPNPIATPGSNITYTLNASSTAGCNTTGTVNIVVQQPLQINVSPNRAVCGRATTNLLAVGANTYRWSPAAGLSSTTIPNPVASPDTTTNYMVIGYDLNGCFEDTGYIKITVNPIPAIELGPDVTLPTGTVFQMQPQVLSGPIVSWLWTPAINLSCTTCPRPTTVVKFDIAYNAQVRNIYGCVANDSIRIHTFCEGSQVFVPNAFTPDGDGRNDILIVRSSGVNLVRSFKIYSRWGELIFEKNNFPPNSPAFGWDGRIKGKIGSAEVYVYTLEVTCDNNEKIVFKGNISILN